MPIFFNRSKHKEFESNSALNLEIRRKEEQKNLENQAASQKGAKFSHCVTMLLHFLDFLPF